nr:CRISPR-associated endonuclease Cas1 [Pseudonocardia sp. C8]
MVAHHAFCPRRAWLEALGETTDTHQVAVGVAAHHAVDDPGRSRAQAMRSVDVLSAEHGLVGRCDSVQIDDDGRTTVVEYKSTPVRRRPAVTDAMRVQLALQTIALREQGRTVDAAAIWFVDHRQYADVAIGPDELDAALEQLRRLRAVLDAQTAPEPLVDDPRCRTCSHAGVCLPDERALEPVTRRVLVADPDSQVLHLATPGARAALRSGRVRVVKGDDELRTVPIERVLALVVHGNVDVSSGLLRELLWRRCPTVWCSGTGRVIGWASSANSPNGGPRVHQHVASANGHLGLARGFVAAKIGNQATMIRRHGEGDAHATLRRLQRRADDATSTAELYGIEGDAAARYFEAFTTMLSPSVRQWASFAGRTRRPASDPVNAALNLTYGLLLSDAIRAIVACGLDPHAGFLHSSGRNKPALALDLIEEFRAPVADSVVIGTFNNGELKPASFSHVTGSTRLRDSGRAAVITAYERRVTTSFRHPIFGYDVTWRRAMEVQARLILGVLDGTQHRYKGVTVR